VPSAVAAKGDRAKEQRAWSRWIHAERAIVAWVAKVVFVETDASPSSGSVVPRMVAARRGPRGSAPAPPFGIVHKDASDDSMNCPDDW